MHRWPTAWPCCVKRGCRGHTTAPRCPMWGWPQSAMTADGPAWGSPSMPYIRLPYYWTPSISEFPANVSLYNGWTTLFQYSRSVTLCTWLNVKMLTASDCEYWNRVVHPLYNETFAGN